MRVERDDRRHETRVDSGADDGAVAEVDAVERADRDGALADRQLLREARNRHASASTPLRMGSGTRARASGGRRSSTAATGCSSTASTVSASVSSNGPIAVRRSEMQWPPSACAIART